LRIALGLLKHFYETTVSTFKDPPQAAARLLEPEFEQERSGHPAQSPSRRSQASDPCLIEAGLWELARLRHWACLEVAASSAVATFTGSKKANA
jgi:hypothetical protein